MGDLDVQPMTATEAGLPDFKETELGPLPQEWDMATLGEIATVKQGKTPKKSQYVHDGRYKVLKVRDISPTGFINWGVDKEGLVNEHLGDSNQVEQGDTLILSAAHSPKIVGTKIGFVQDLPDKISTVFHVAELIKVRGKDSNRLSDSYYIYALLKSEGARNRVREMVKGGHLYASSLSNLEIPLPSLSEQRSIAHVLRTVQKAIETTEQVIEATRELKRSLMNHLFTYGPASVDKAEQVRLKETEIGPVPEHWEISRLGDVAKIVSGGTPSRKIPDYWNGTIPWVKTGEITYNVITTTEEMITDRGLEESSARLVPAGTLLLAMYGQGVTRGRVATLGIDAAINQACAAIFPAQRMKSRFLYHYLTYKYENIRNLGHGAHQKNLSATLLKSLTIPSPSITEQEEVIHSLDAVDNKISTEVSSKASLGVLYKTLIHNLMRGKVRVKDLDLSAVEEMV